MIHVASVTPEAGFALVLGFSNGEQRRFDMNAYLDFPVYRIKRTPTLIYMMPILPYTLHTNQGV